MSKMESVEVELADSIWHMVISLDMACFPGWSQLQLPSGIE
jgi:hypothetical protein